MTDERIVAAAIIQNGEVYTGTRHAFIIREIFEKTEKRVNGEQGFVTDTGRFVDRREAARIAIKAGQIERLPYGSSLYSEWILPLKESDA